MKHTEEKIQAYLDEFRKTVEPKVRASTCPFQIDTECGPRSLCSICSKVLSLFPPREDEYLGFHPYKRLSWQLFLKPKRIGADPYHQEPLCPCPLFGVAFVKTKIQTWERRNSNG